MLVWCNQEVKVGDLRAYISDVYPAYAALGLRTWDDIIAYLVSENEM